MPSPNVEHTILQLEQVAILDANVLGSRLERGVLLAMSHARLFTAIWTKDILNEIEFSYLPQILKEPNSPEIASRIVSRIAENYPLSCISGYEKLNPSFELKDVDDLHVIKAAIRANAKIIVTHDRHFSNEILNPHGFWSMTPDKFITFLAVRHSVGSVTDALIQANHTLFKNPRLSMLEFAGILRSRKLIDTANLFERSTVYRSEDWREY